MKITAKTIKHYTFDDIDEDIYQDDAPGEDRVKSHQLKSATIEFEQFDAGGHNLVTVFHGFRYNTSGTLDAREQRRADVPVLEIADPQARTQFAFVLACQTGDMELIRATQDQMNEVTRRMIAERPAPTDGGLREPGDIEPSDNGDGQPDADQIVTDTIAELEHRESEDDDA